MTVLSDYDTATQEREKRFSATKVFIKRAALPTHDEWQRTALSYPANASRFKYYLTSNGVQFFTIRMPFFFESHL